MRHGYSLPELVLVLCLLGILAAVVLPSGARFHDTLSVERGARRVASSYGNARLLALTHGREVALIVTADSIAVRVAGDTLRPPLWITQGPAADGATLDGVQLRKARFAATGLGWGTPNATIVVRRGNLTRSVVISRLGRVRIRAP